MHTRMQPSMPNNLYGDTQSNNLVQNTKGIRIHLGVGLNLKQAGTVNQAKRKHHCGQISENKSETIIY